MSSVHDGQNQSGELPPLSVDFPPPEAQRIRDPTPFVTRTMACRFFLRISYRIPTFATPFTGHFPASLSFPNRRICVVQVSGMMRTSMRTASPLFLALSFSPGPLSNLLPSLFQIHVSPRMVDDQVMTWIAIHLLSGPAAPCSFERFSPPQLSTEES